MCNLFLNILGNAFCAFQSAFSSQAVTGKLSRKLRENSLKITINTASTPELFLYYLKQISTKLFVLQCLDNARWQSAKQMQAEKKFRVMKLCCRQYNSLALLNNLKQCHEKQDSFIMQVEKVGVLSRRDEKLNYSSSTSRKTGFVSACISQLKPIELFIQTSLSSKTQYSVL